jgi:hypothetical protein
MSAAASIIAQNIGSTVRANQLAFGRDSDAQIESRLNTLLAQNADYARRKALYRTYQEEIDSLSMRSPLTAMQAYGMLGLFLGAFPPAAYFIRSGAYGLDHNGSPVLLAMLLFMNIVCALVGWRMGMVFGERAQRLERDSWSKMFLGISLIALGWAGVTGFSGGVIVLVIGGIFGAFFAAPVAMAGFALFSVIHRLMERGALMERRHVLPVAIGISLTISAFIMGLG